MPVAISGGDDGFASGATAVDIARQIETDGGSLADLAVDVGVPARLFHEPIDRAEAKAGPPPRLLGGKERLERAGDDIGRHADPFVGHREFDVVTRSCIGRMRQIVLRQCDIAGLDQDPAAVRHGVARIDRKVQNSILDLAGIDPCHPEVRGQLGGHVDTFAERAPQQLGHADRRVVEIDHGRLQGAAPAERQEPAGEPRTHAGGLFGPADEITIHLVFKSHVEQLEIAGDDCQQIVEVVREAAGQLADRFHLLRLSQLPFGLAQRQFGRVAI